ncbi:hypothetical protein T4A_3590 [Trichinella pseudospiralis]|uniref:Uncharacterized protein n=1 Tax=Trichinella pseudospiralis TaxID=6337 RepID=A0A0V1DQV7_TRIPS|nr:hypothetical protein T4A_10283 [Trichinella pseudospiralis]KRY63803.1 hypothetical protein T4A_3590 [Trichinella pseudospiralis]
MNRSGLGTYVELCRFLLVFHSLMLRGLDHHEKYHRHTAPPSEEFVPNFPLRDVVS